MKLKLDLHTHCFEAMNYAKPTLETVSRIVELVKARGLDGIAITEHKNSQYGFEAREILERHFNDEIIIIPGREIWVGFHEVVELYLPDGFIFRFVPHPGFPWDSMPLDRVQGIEIENCLHSINPDLVRQAAEKHGLLLLRNSDAHTLDMIGSFYNEIDLEELSARAMRAAVDTGDEQLWDNNL